MGSPVPNTAKAFRRSPLQTANDQRNCKTSWPEENTARRQNLRRNATKKCDGNAGDTSAHIETIGKGNQKEAPGGERKAVLLHRTEDSLEGIFLADAWSS